MAVLVVSCGRSSHESQRSGLDTVHIPQTGAKNQYSVGFCWAYSVAGLMEAVELKNGTTLDLSEEYLGFYHIFDQLKKILDASDPVAALHDVHEGFRVPGALKLAEEVGMVPEDVFNFKFDATGDLQARIGEHFSKTFADPAKLRAYRSNDRLIFSELVEIFGKKPIQPTDSFTFQGKRYTPISFMKERISVRADDFESITFTPDNFDMVTHYLKRALADQMPVPYSTMTLFGIGGDDPVWDASKCKDTGCLPDGGHAMLAVDFVTEGGRGGAMSAAEVKKVFHNPFQAVIVKNSWGLVGNGQDGTPAATENDKGYFTITRSFIETAMMRGGVEILVLKALMKPEQLFFESTLNVAVDSKDIAKGFVPINKNITLSGVVLGLSKKQDFGNVSFTWNIKNKSNGSIVQTAKGQDIHVTLSQAGTYEIAVTASVGREEFTGKRVVWAAERVTDNIFELNGAFATTNRAEITSTGDRKLFLDTTRGQIVSDLSQSLVELPKIKMSLNGRVKFTFHLSDTESISHALQASTDGISFESVWCAIDEDEEENSAVKAKDETCVYPTSGGFEGSGDVYFRLVFDEMPLKESMWKGVLEIGPAALELANADVDDAGGWIYLPSRYPNSATFKNFTSPKRAIALEGLFSSDVEKVDILVGDKVVASIPASQMKSASEQGFKVATFSFNPDREGVYKVKMVGVKANVRSSYVSYEVFASAPQAVKRGGSWKLSGSSIAASQWLTTSYGLSAAAILPKGQGVDPKPLDNNKNLSAAMTFDLTASRKTSLTISTIYLLEENWDFFFVKVSSDGGKTFDVLARETGSQVKGKSINLDLSKYDGSSNVIVRLDVITDNGGPSKLVLVKEMLLASQ